MAGKELRSSENCPSAGDALGSTDTTFGNGLTVGTKDKLDGSLAEGFQAKDGEIFVVEVVVVDQNMIGLFRCVFEVDINISITS